MRRRTRCGAERISKCAQNGLEILGPLTGFVHVSGWAMGRWASSVYDTADLVDEIPVVDVTPISKRTHFCFVIEIVGIVGRVQLHLLGPEEQTCNPFEIRMLDAIANFVGSSAEVNVRKER